MKLEYVLEGLDCAHCASEIEQEIAKLDGVAGANVDFVTKKLRLQTAGGQMDSRTGEIERSVRDTVKRLEPGVVVRPHRGYGENTARDESEHSHGHAHGEHDHAHDGGKREIILAVLSAVLLGAAFFVENEYGQLALYLISYLAVGGEVIYKSLRSIGRGRVFVETFLMMIATFGAFAIGEYPEGVAVMLFYQVGELFQSYAVRRSRRSISDLMDIRPDYANVERDGQLVRIAPSDVAVGTVIVVKPGERIPLDGVVVSGQSRLDTSALTGESKPRGVQADNEVLSGCVNLDGMLHVRVTKAYAESTVAKILDLIENAGSKKAETEQFITKFARVYTPIVVAAALLLAFVPPIFVSNLSQWVYRALVFLVISCPCALVISVPLSFFGGIGSASRQGILIKGGNYLEALAHLDTVVFDKTGTLTKGVFRVQEIHAAGMGQEELLRFAAYAEGYSNHPIAVSLREAYGKEIDHAFVSDVRETAGQGVTALVDGHTVSVGNRRLMGKLDCPEIAGTTAHVSVDGAYAGYITIADEVKPDATGAISELKRAGVEKTVMLTGDEEAAAREAAGRIGIDEFYAGLLPGGKVEKVEGLLSAQKAGAKLAFVGDGINDAPVIARADVGVSMGGLGASDAAIEAADVVIMTDEPSKLADAVRISRYTLRIVKQNIAFALGVKLLVMLLGAFGVATMWEAVFADVGVSLIAVLNAIRALKYCPR